MDKKRIKKIKKESKLWLLLIVSCFIRGLAIHAFVVPNNFAPGGITGISTMLDYALGNKPLITGISNTSFFLFVLNIPTVIISYFVFSRSYAVKTTVAMFLLSGFMVLIEQVEAACGVDFTYVQNSENMQPILAAIAAGVCNGVALSMIIHAGGSNGGTDVLGAMIQKKIPYINVSWFITILDSIVIFFSFFVFQSAYATRLTPVLLALINSFCASKVCDTIMHGFKTATKFEVITPHPEELAGDLIKVLGRSVTRIEAEGMYTHSNISYLVCVVRNRQIPLFYDVLKKYPETFAYLSSTKEVIGRGFTRPAPNVKIDLKPIENVKRSVDLTAVIDDEDEYEDKLKTDYMLRGPAGEKKKRGKKNTGSDDGKDANLK